MLVCNGLPFIIFLFQRLHVLSNVATKDVFLEHFTIESLALWVVPRETLLGVGDEYTTVTCALHCAEDTVASGSALETNIKVALEGSWSIFII